MENEFRSIVGCIMKRQKACVAHSSPLALQGVEPLKAFG